MAESLRWQINMFTYLFYMDWDKSLWSHSWLPDDVPLLSLLLSVPQNLSLVCLVCMWTHCDSDTGKPIILDLHQLQTLRTPLKESVLQLFRSFFLLFCHSWCLLFSTRCQVDVCPAENDDATPSSTDVEPASEKRDPESLVSQPITQQPEPQAPETPTAATTHQVKQFKPWPQSLLHSDWLEVPEISCSLSNPQRSKLIQPIAPPNGWSRIIQVYYNFSLIFL